MYHQITFEDATLIKCRNSMLEHKKEKPVANLIYLCTSSNATEHANNKGIRVNISGWHDALLLFASYQG